MKPTHPIGRWNGVLMIAFSYEATALICAEEKAFVLVHMVEYN